MEKSVKPLLLVGLGNPGRKFHGTRHNVGFDVVDRVADVMEARWVSRQGGDVEVVEMRDSDRFGRRNVVLLKPMTFMNCSGGGVGGFLRRRKEHEVVVVHDDLDLVLGKVKVKFGGSDGGHRGLRSLDERIGRGYWRVRIGIGRGVRVGVGGVEDYVLGRFRGEEGEVMGGMMEGVAEGLGVLCGEELTAERAGIFVGGLG